MFLVTDRARDAGLLVRLVFDEWNSVPDDIGCTNFPSARSACGRSCTNFRSKRWRFRLDSNVLACGLASGFGAYAPGYLKKPMTPIAPIRRNAQTNNPIRHGRLRSPVGRQLNIAFPGRGFSVGRSRVPQSSFSRVRFSQKTLSTSSSLGCDADRSGGVESSGSPGGDRTRDRVLHVERDLVVDTADENRKRPDLDRVAIGQDVAIFWTEDPAVQRQNIRCREIRENVMGVAKRDPGMDARDRLVVENDVARLEPADEDAALGVNALSARPTPGQ